MNVTELIYSNAEETAVIGLLEGTVIEADENDPNFQMLIDEFAPSSVAAFDLETVLILQLKPIREARLLHSDRYKEDDFPLGSVTPQQILDYRTDLRDAPTVIDFSSAEDLADAIALLPADPVTA